MKKIIYTILCCLVFGMSYAAVVKYQEVAVGSIVEAQEVVIGSVVEIEEVAVGCASVVTDSETGAQDGNRNLSATANSSNYAAKFVTTSAYTVCKVGVYLKKVTGGSPTMNVTVSIYDNNTDEPGSLVGTASTSRNAATFGVGETEEVFVGLSAPLDTATPYWIVISGDAYDGTHYFEWFYDSTAPTTTETESSPDLSTWTNVDSGTYSLKYQLYR